MHTKQLNEHLHIIDLKPTGVDNFIASYVLKGPKATAIIETGPTCSIPNLLTGLNEIRVKNDDIDYIMVSHIHIDHAGGAGTLMRHLPNAKLIVHPRGAPHIINPQKLWEQSQLVLGEVATAYGKIEPAPENRVITPSDGTLFDLGGSVQVKVLETLGHASHHLGYYDPDSQGIFQGDAAGIYFPHLDVTIPTAPAPFQFEMTLASLEKLTQLQPKRLYYTHYGPVDNAVERIKRYEAQLHLWANVVSEAVKRGDTKESVHEQILKTDPQMKAAIDFINKHLVLRKGVVMQNIHGYVEYYKKKLLV
ncbi:MAG TPA: MBL fold metallo-hydrolase [Candidatus Bathyarchaeia archaeon]|nr:MBL fold metallo-hydrolase [Candidatus Bathyarchaeia archaeon]